MNLNVNFDLYRTVKTGNFNPVITYEIIASDLCRISMQSMHEQLRDGDNNILTDFSVIIEYSDEVQKDDILVIGENAYRINSIDDPDEMHHHLELGVLKLQPGFMR